MKICRKCVMPNTKPDLTFDDHGVCDACRSHEMKKTVIDWKLLNREFAEIVERNRSNSSYDCLVPVSGGKDSTYQVLKILELGLKPLCVCFEPTIPTKLGRENLNNLQNLGVDLILVKKDPIVYRKMVLEGFKVLGDNEWPNHVGIFTVPVHFAVNFNIPLIIWGENSQFEYGGPASSKNNKYLNRKWLEEFGGLLGYRVNDMVGVDGITQKDLYLYQYPDDLEVERVGVTGLFLGYYFPWETRKQTLFVKSKGFKCADRSLETTYTSFENLDCYSMTVHDYLKYCKYGFGRATDHACLDIRNGHISRNEAVRLATKYDGNYPHESIKKFCDWADIKESEFQSVVDIFTNKNIFETFDNGSFKRDIDNSLVKKDKYRLS